MSFALHADYRACRHARACIFLAITAAPECPSYQFSSLLAMESWLATSCQNHLRCQRGMRSLLGSRAAAESNVSRRCSAGPGRNQACDVNEYSANETQDVRIHISDGWFSLFRITSAFAHRSCWTIPAYYEMDGSAVGKGRKMPDGSY